MHPTMTAYLDALVLTGRAETARTYGEDLALLDRWLTRERIDALAATTEQLRGFQRYLAQEHRTPSGEPLSRGTQSRRVSAVRSYYRWLERRGLIVVDVARPLVRPKVRRLVTTARDYLTLQEATALLQTEAERVAATKSGTTRWAQHVRNLAFLCVAIASGRRRGGLRNLRVSDLDQERDELRCEREKGKGGRVLPIARWAMSVACFYRERARPILDPEGASDVLFVSSSASGSGVGTRMNKPVIRRLIQRAHRDTVAANPDLVELAGKHLTTHSLRVSFATLLFSGGCNIRSINELMLHEHLETTARYTPVPLEDLRRACQAAHPRA